MSHSPSTAAPFSPWRALRSTPRSNSTASQPSGAAAERTVRLASSPNLPRRLLAQLINAAQPAVRIQLVPELITDPDRLDALRRGDVDVAIVRGPIAVPGWAEATVLLTERLGVMFRADDPLAMQPTVAPSALAGRRLLRFPRAWAPEVWDTHEAALTAAGILADPHDISTDVTQTLDLVIAGAVALVGTYWTEGKAGMTWRPIDDVALWLEHLLLTRIGAGHEVHRIAVTLREERIARAEPSE